MTDIGFLLTFHGGLLLRPGGRAPARAGRHCGLEFQNRGCVLAARPAQGAAKGEEASVEATAVLDHLGEHALLAA